MREPELTGADALRALYEAKADAELADADALAAVAPGSWRGPVVGSRVAFVAGVADEAGGILADRVADAAMKAAGALGADGLVFVIASRPGEPVPADVRARRLRLALETADPPAVIALDTDAAADLADAFELDRLREGTAVRAFGRAIGSAGDFAGSLDDPKAKARAWSAMKATAALAGLAASAPSGAAARR